MLKKYPLIFLLCAAIFALVFAYISEFVFELKPCVLCLYQRKPFFAIIALCALQLAFFRNKKAEKFFFFCCLALLALNIGIASYHVGVEQKIFQGPTTCSADELNNLQNVEELAAALAQTKAIRCDAPSFVFLGVSMAGWNVFYSLFLLIAALFLKKK